FEIDASALQAGNYMVSLSLHSADHQVNYHRLDNALSFYIDRPTRNFDGIAALPVARISLARSHANSN
ncbi:MAG: Wzt carbohydrate-binding domain-containing protein, partial [Kiritimatiellae bacterium]|nr:Wzt carbohydrate-binding domain-containing protein [Kiritimatiellia bacterium]